MLTFHVVLASTEEGKLPAYLGSTLRGALGHSMRRFVCVFPDRRCHLCELASSCSYAIHFNSPGNDGGAVNPFVLNPITQDKLVWNKGDLCEFNLTLIGDSAVHAGIYLDAIQDMAARGLGVGRLPFDVLQITNASTNALIWHAGKAWLRNCRPSRPEFAPRASKAVLVRFDTPVRVISGQRLHQRLSFVDLAHSLYRRIELLSQAYSQERFIWESHSVLKAADQIQTSVEYWEPIEFERYSMTRGGTLQLGAIRGWARYEGELTPFTPILEAGKLLHAGKNATIGFGHYQLAYDQ
jgi:hypothetical protein